MKIHVSTPLLCLAIVAVAASARAQDLLPTGGEGPPAAASSLPAPARSDPGLRFNFRGAPLETVLNYLSEAAGFVIVLQTPVTGTVDMWSSQSVTKAEAVQLLNIVLNKNGYSAMLQGRSLIISTKDDAKKQNIPIHIGNDPADIPLTAQMVMQIIPLRHIDATQAAKDLATLMPSSATVTPNQDSNSLVVTDTQMNVHHIVEVISALDTSVDTVSTTRVFQLKNADPYEMAGLITSLYGSPTAGTTGTNAPGQFRGNGFAGGGFGGAGGGAAARFGGGNFAGGGFGGGNAGGAAANRGGTAGARAGGGRATPVVAIADPRTYSIVVNAGKDQMPEIAEMIARLDANSGRKQKAFTITMQNADVQEVQTILQNLFQSSTSRTTTSTQADPLSSRATTNAQAATTTPALNLGSTSTAGR